MMKFSTASYTSPIFTANNRPNRKGQNNHINNKIEQETNKNNISSKLKTGALVSTAFLAGLGLNFQVNSCSDQKEDLNKPQIEQITKESIDSIETKPENVFIVKDSLIQKVNKKDSIEDNDKKEIKNKKKAKTQTTKPKTQKTQPKEKAQNQSNKTQPKEMDEGAEMLLELMMFGE